MTNHVITLYPTLVKRLTARGWWGGDPRAITADVFFKTHGKYTYMLMVDYLANVARVSRYERLSK